MKRAFKIIAYILLILGIASSLVIITINSLQTQQISKIVKNILEFKLSSGSFKIIIDDCKIEKPNNDFYNLTISGLQIYQKLNGAFDKIGSAQSINISLNTHELLRLKYVPVNIEIDKFNFELSRDPDKIEEVTEGFLENMISIIKSQLFWVGNIHLKNSKLGFLIGNRTRLLNISETNMALDKAQKKINLKLTYELSNLKQHSHDLFLDLSLVKNRYLNVSANLNSLPAHLPISQLSMSRFKNLQNAANELMISGTIFHSYDSRKRAHTSVINLTNLTGKLYSQFEDSAYLNIMPSKCYIEILDDYDKLRVSNCALNFMNPDKSSGNLTVNAAFDKKKAKPQLFELSGNLENIPVNIFNFISDPEDPDPVKKFLDEFIVKGDLKHGKWKIKLDKNFFNNNSFNNHEINANFQIENAGFKYEGGHPQINNISADIQINNSSVKFSNVSGQVERSYINNSHISFDWNKWDNEGINVECSIKGPAGDVIKYVDSQQIHALKAKGVDLTTLEGIADTHVKVHVPLAKELPVKVTVEASSDDFGMKFMNGTIHLKRTNLKASFDEKKLLLSGQGLLNGLPATLNFEHNFTESAPIEDQLNADIILSNKLEPNEFFSIKNGESRLKLNYSGKDDKSNWNIESDIKDIELYIDKIGLIKPAGKGGYFKYISSTNPSKDESANFELKATNGIDIIGSIVTKSNSTKVIIEKLNYGDTKLKAQLDFSSNNKDYKIYGTSFDLSKSDLGKLFSSGERTTASSYDINIDRIFLKSNIDLKSLKLQLKCTKDKCYKGYMNSYLGDSRRFFDMLVKDYEDYEEWTFTSNNAGAVFRGLGIYDNIRSGTMLMRMKHTHNIGAKDKIHSSPTYGTLNIHRFATVKTPFFTKLISFISHPGTTLTSKNFFLFRSFDSKFEINDGEVTIFDGEAEGPFFDFNIRGKIDTNKKIYELKGEVIPSLYGINYLVKKIPIVGQALSGGRRKGIIYAPFVLRDNY